jgi:hypothetical protein
MDSNPINTPEEPRESTVRIRRDHVLGYAGDLSTERSNPVAVAANAKVLIDWVETGDAAEQYARYRSLSRASHNREFDRTPDDDPALLIAEAEVFYAFLKAA